ncbi:MAG TPA: hypothetical protein VMK42_02895 [Anaeromyxobacteraceae bacterium]|nr:hypothetical protein [Anaeromyxobacteraceae bacterium]
MAHGEHLRILIGGRLDHAVDCGDRTVLHLALPPNGRLPAVKRSLLADFTYGAERVEVVRHTERTHPPKMVVSRAFSKLGDSAAWAMFPTPEHFVVWCLTGQTPIAHPEPEGAAAAPAEVVPAAPAAKPAKKAAAARAPAKAGAKPKARVKASPKGVAKAVKKPARKAARKPRAAKARAAAPKKAARKPARAKGATSKVARKPTQRKKPSKKR